MRTVLAFLAFAAASHAAAHDGHGAGGAHTHGVDLLWLVAAAVGVALWLWQRDER